MKRIAFDPFKKARHRNIRMPKHIVIVGCGNVGSNLLHHLGEVFSVAKVSIVDIDPMVAEAAILDLAGYKPDLARKVVVGSLGELQHADLIIHSAGQKTVPGDDSGKIPDQNKAILDSLYKEVSFKPETIMISLPGPVEMLTAYIVKAYKVDHRKVIGFGGALDLNRLRYLLHDQGLNDTNVHFIGEHGDRGIPVYAGEKSYPEICDKLQGFLDHIGSLAGTKRNLATAPLLAALVETIVFGVPKVHYVAAYHSGHNITLTWPFLINGVGIVKPVKLDLPRYAKRDLDRLVKQKR